MSTLSLIPLLIVLVGIVGGSELLFLWRASAMRKFAARRGFGFREGNTSIFFPPADPRPIPFTFRPRTYPANKMDQTWNVIEGDVKGISILILDSRLNLGSRRQNYCTFIAARAEISPFHDRDPQEETVLTNGWIALYRLRYWPFPWTLSIKRLEKHLDNL